jgi:hypothetical protein
MTVGADVLEARQAVVVVSIIGARTVAEDADEQAPYSSV